MTRQALYFSQLLFLNFQWRTILHRVCMPGTGGTNLYTWYNTRFCISLSIASFHLSMSGAAIASHMLWDQTIARDKSHAAVQKRTWLGDQLPSSSENIAPPPCLPCLRPGDCSPAPSCLQPEHKLHGVVQHVGDVTERSFGQWVVIFITAIACCTVVYHSASWITQWATGDTAPQ